MAEQKVEARFVGQSVKRLEDPRLLTGRGAFMDELRVSNMMHAAILRSPHAHARIRGVDTAEALKVPGVRAVLTGEDVRRMSRPFSMAVQIPVRYYSLAVDKARFVGEPVAVVIAKDRYVAEDAADLVQVDYEPLPPVVDIEKAMEPGAPLLHEELGSNIANHRLLRYGDVDRAFSEADRIVRGTYHFPKYSSTPLEGFAVIANFDPITGLMTIWSNFQGPFIMHPVVSMALGVPEHKLRFIVPADNGGGFGIKSSIYPYMTLIALAARKAGCPVKWIEDRKEHLLASSSGTDRVAVVEAAVKRDGTILGVRMKNMDGVGGYLRTPEPACLFRTTGNSVGAYRFQHLEIDAYAVMANKSPTGPNRGYGCQQLYFGIERLVDQIAKELNLDPAEVRFQNLIRKEEMPYLTPSGGLYDSGDYPEGLRKALEMIEYDKLRQEQRRARAEGRLFGIGLATVVDPSVTNMAYITVANEPEERARPDYNFKAGSGETAAVKIDPLGKVSVALNTTPEGQGHETIAAMIVADELGIPMDDVQVLAEMDTATRVWSITTGTYSSRFASVGTSAVATAARKVKEKILKIAAHELEATVEDLDMREGKVFVRGSPGKAIPLKRIAGIAHWNQARLPEGMEPGLHATTMFNFPTAKPPDQQDRVNSSNTYGFIAEAVAVEVDPETGEIQIKKYVTVHDCGTILNPMIVEGQVYGGVVHGLGGALYEEMAYDENGQYLAATFMDYLCPTAMESPKLEIGHVVSPSPLTVLGSKGCGESSSMTTPAVIANAVEDALAPLGISINELPLTPDKIWRWIRAARERAGRGGAG
ncbi:MAG: xanthine dehydrogenase family protein molybdopterin-binding subunit [Deltaproteobacteria bacterium]|nr:xanthine dehydrogenase family protein molybdopterin-binding subunit [Deltaproteobacteria bacterium]